MPQLDILSYQTQFFWLFLVFILFFSLNHLLVLPRFYTLLKVKKSFMVIIFNFIEFYKFLQTTKQLTTVFSLIQKNNFSILNTLNLFGFNFLKLNISFTLFWSKIKKNSFLFKHQYKQSKLYHLLCLV